MSTYYNFRCEECKEQGGFMSRQMWGIGNADLVETFKFLMHHAVNLGHPDALRMQSEHEDCDYPDVSTPMPDDPEGLRNRFLDETADIFPRSNDWKFMREIPDGEDFLKAWVERERKQKDD